MESQFRNSGLILGALLASVLMLAAKANAAASSSAAHALTLDEAKNLVSGFSSSVDATSKTASIKGSIAKDCVEHFKLESDARVAEDNWVRFRLADVSGEGVRCLEIYRDVCPGDKCISFDALSNDPKTTTKFRSSVPLLDSEIPRAKVGLVASLLADTSASAPLRKPEIRIENLEASGACTQCKPAMGKTGLDELTKPMADIVERGRFSPRGPRGRDKFKKPRDRDMDDDDEDVDDDEDGPPMRFAKNKSKRSDDRYDLVDQSAHRRKFQSIMLQSQGQGGGGQSMGMGMSMGLNGGSGLMGGLGYESVLSASFASPYALLGYGHRANLSMGYGNQMSMGYGNQMSMGYGNQMSMGYGNQISAFWNPYSLSSMNGGSGMSFGGGFGLNYGSNYGSNYGLGNMSAIFGRGY